MKRVGEWINRITIDALDTFSLKQILGLCRAMVDTLYISNQTTKTLTILYSIYCTHSFCIIEL